jgi:oligopeptide transport system permease protein
MLRLVLTRVVGGIIVLFCVFTFSFFMLRAAPGGPFTAERTVHPEVMRNIEKRYNYDWPLWKQYLNEVRKLATGDLGQSVIRNNSVMEIIKDSFPVSLRLGVMALAFATLFGTLLGVFAAVKQNSWFDHGSMAVALFGISIPSFVLGPILIMIFSLQLAWLPPARYQGWTYLILPSMTLGLIYMGVVARLARSGLLETMRQDYIRTARAKGLSEGVVVWKHAVRLGIMPVVTFLGPATAALITGSFVVEKIFQLPGLGFYFVASISDRDYPVLSGVLVFYAIFLVFLNLAVDIAYGILDPRIRDKR